MNKVLTNIFKNFIPNKLVTFDDKDPSWRTDYVRNKIRWKNEIYSSFVKSGRTRNDNWSDNVNKRKNDYNEHLGCKFNDSNTNAKIYWSIRKTFYIGKKRPIIPPLLVNDNVVSDFKANANLFNKLFCLIMYTLRKQ